MLGLIVAISAPLLAGFAGSLLTRKEIKGWYTKIRKPSWTPPNWLFGPVWGVLYISQGIASWLVWKERAKQKVLLPLLLYGQQLLLNLIWTPLFFTLHRPLWAAIDSAGIFAVGTAATVTMSKIAGPAKVLPLMVPYLAWIGFATALAADIAVQNPQAHLIKSSDTISTTNSAEESKK
jgi:benzodiazapine receptor